MDLERISVDVRQRTPWEAADLGFTMVRAWSRPIYVVWLATICPLSLVLLLLFHELPWLPLLIVWWLEPLFDRLVLAVVSRAFFGERPGPWRILRNPREYLGRGLLGALTFGRLSPWRTYLSPICQLEGLGGPARRRRAGLIGRVRREFAVALGAIFLLFELGVLCGSGMLLLMLVPAEQVGASLATGTWSQSNIFLLLFVLYLLALTLVEPLYVAAGFALYVNRRIQLEGWDLELGLRRMADRLRGQAERIPAPRTGAAAPLLAVALAVAAAALMTPARSAAREVPSGAAAAASSAGPLASAASPPSSGEAGDGMPEVTAAAPGSPPGSQPPPDAEQVISEVLAAPEFQTYETREVYRPKADDDQRDTQLPDLSFIEKLAQLLSRLLYWAMIVLAAGLISYLAVVSLAKYRRTRGNGSGRRRQQARPDTLFGLDLRPESLPPDLLEVVLRQWQRGDATAALSLLYRGSLAHVVERLSVDIPASATEGECVELVRDNLPPPLRKDFELLTGAWQLTAYGHRRPSDQQFRELHRRWERHLEGGP